MLLIALFIYDDPLYLLKANLPDGTYEVCRTIAESTFISLLLFFWILVVHSIAQVSHLIV